MKKKKKEEVLEENNVEEEEAINKIKKSKKKKVKKRIKVKKKKVVFIPLFILLFIIIGVSSFLFYQKYRKDTLTMIKNNYSQYVVLKRNSKLYSKNKKVIGSISKGFEFELENVKNLTIENQYFQIKNTSYYVNYKDIKKIKKISTDELSDKYVVYNKNITGKNISFYQDKKKVLTINEKINIPILMMDKDNYIVSYFHKLLNVKKDKNINVIDATNTEDKEASYVSVFYYEVISPTCNDVNCVPSATVKDNLSKLKENGYYEISKYDYIQYLNG